MEYKIDFKSNKTAAGGGVSSGAGRSGDMQKCTSHLEKELQQVRPQATERSPAHSRSPRPERASSSPGHSRRGRRGRVWAGLGEIQQSYKKGNRGRPCTSLEFITRDRGGHGEQGFWNRPCTEPQGPYANTNYDLSGVSLRICISSKP